MIESVTKIFAEYGGLIGLVILALFSMVAYLIHKITRIAQSLLKAVEQNDARLIDLKKAIWSAEKLPDRRGERR